MSASVARVVSGLPDNLLFVQKATSFCRVNVMARL